MSLTNGAPTRPRIHNLGDALVDAQSCTIGQAKQIANANTNALAEQFTRVLQQQLPPIVNGHRALVDAHNALLRRVEYLESRTLRGRWIQARLWILNHATRFIASRHHVECVFLIGGPFNGRLVTATRLLPRSPTSGQHRIAVSDGPDAIYQGVEHRDTSGRRCLVFVGHESADTADPTVTPPAPAEVD